MCFFRITHFDRYKTEDGGIIGTKLFLVKIVKTGRKAFISIANHHRIDLVRCSDNEIHGLKHMTKDIGFAPRTADDNGAMALIGHTVFQLHRQSMGQGLADIDFAAVKKV